MRSKKAKLVQCVACNHCTFREHPGTTSDKSVAAAEVMAKKHGLGRCLVGNQARFLPPMRDRVCSRFSAANDDTTAARMNLLAKRA